MSTQVKRIALLIGQDLGYCRSVLEGIHMFSIEKRDWIFRDASPTPASLRPLRQWKPDGIICHLFDESAAKSIVRMRIPTVNTTNSLNLKLPLVEVDHDGVGRMAANYFLAKRFRNFAYIGSDRTGFSKGREKGFVDCLQKSGYEASICHLDYLPRIDTSESWTKIDDAVTSWLRKLPKPVAVFASNDIPARDLSDACLRLEIKVPDEVAILGVDNDEFECGFGRPPLSSVAIPGVEIGYTAAKMLDTMLSGKSPDSATIFLPPIRVVERQSTDVIAIDDPVVSATLAFIRQNYAENIGVEDIARHVDTSRRGIERAFRKKMNRSVLDEIRNFRIARAQDLLADTNDSIEIV